MHGLPTRYGPLDFSISAPDPQSLRVTIGGSIGLPPGGLSIAPPLPAGKQIVRATCSNGMAPVIAPSGASITVGALPFQATLHLGARPVPQG